MKKIISGLMSFSIVFSSLLIAPPPAYAQSAARPDPMLVNRLTTELPELETARTELISIIEQQKEDTAKLTKQYVKEGMAEEEAYAKAAYEVSYASAEDALRNIFRYTMIGTLVAAGVASIPVFLTGVGSVYLTAEVSPWLSIPLIAGGVGIGYWAINAKNLILCILGSEIAAGLIVGAIVGVIASGSTMNNRLNMQSVPLEEKIAEFKNNPEIIFAYDGVRPEVLAMMLEADEEAMELYQNFYTGTMLGRKYNSVTPMPLLEKEIEKLSEADMAALNEKGQKAIAISHAVNAKALAEFDNIVMREIELQKSAEEAQERFNDADFNKYSSRYGLSVPK